MYTKVSKCTADMAVRVLSSNETFCYSILYSERLKNLFVLYLFVLDDSIFKYTL